jgi:hypothetical protein
MRNTPFFFEALTAAQDSSMLLLHPLFFLVVALLAEPFIVVEHRGLSSKLSSVVLRS